MFDAFKKRPLIQWGWQKSASSVTSHNIPTPPKLVSTKSTDSPSFTPVTMTEMTLLLTWVRAVLEEVDGPDADFASFRSRYLENRPTMNSLAACADTYTVDVILWVDGYIRGSQYVEGKPLLLAIYEATLLARVDSRFKPVSKREYDLTRIELVVMSNEVQPLTAEELGRNEISPEQAYLGVTSSGQRSWLVPATHNCRDFKDLAQFLKVLAEEKLRAASRSEQTVSFYRAAVLDCIESADRTSVIPLRGVRAVDVDRIKEGKIAHIKRALRYVLKNQDTDGNFQPMNSPFSISRPNVADWVRSAFLLSVVARVIKEYPEFPEINAYRAVVDTSYQYLATHLHSFPGVPALQRCLGLIYLHQAAMLRNDQMEMERSHLNISALFKDLPYEPILYTQFALHVYATPLKTADEIRLAEAVIEAVIADFYPVRDREKGANSLELALYADLPNALKAGSQALGRDDWSDLGVELYEWFLTQQKSDGSFPARLGGDFSHTRSTSKMLEALAVYGLPYADRRFQSALSWLHSLQYTEETSYYVPIERRDWLLGGFRQDEQNATAWIDSSAHYLKALSAE